MAKVARDNKEVLRIVQIRRQDLSVALFRGLVECSDQDGHDPDLINVVLKDLVDIGQVHLDAVFVLVRIS